MNFVEINDQWILDRVSKESQSFQQWIDDMVKTAKVKMEKVVNNSEFQNKLTEQEKKDLEEDLVGLKDLDQKISSVMKTIKEKTSQMGRFGNYLSNLGTSLTEKVSNSLQSQLPEDLQLDFITGKKKNLSTALHDVAQDRGITNAGILYLIKALPDLETFLYSTNVKKFYRDHTEHQLRVAVLGDFLLEQEFEQGNLLSIVSEITHLDKHNLKEKYWWLAGLIHDIGYPLEKMSTAINWSLLNQILKCYPQMDLEVSPFEITLSSKKDFNLYLSFLEEGLSKDAKTLIRQGAGLLNSEFPLSNSIYFPGSSTGHPEFKYQPAIQLDHGVIGALNILKSLGSPEKIRDHYDEYQGYLMAARAIALHNFKGRIPDFHFEQQPLAFLLVLLDEMQEWGRPIPIQVRDSYFTIAHERINLLDQIKLDLDNFTWQMEYRNVKAKQMMNFDFNRFSKAKQTGFSRLDHESLFPKTQIRLQDINPVEISQSSQNGSKFGSLINKFTNELVNLENWENNSDQPLKKNKSNKKKFKFKPKKSTSMSKESKSESKKIQQNQEIVKETVITI